MSRGKKVFGICKICGVEGQLSFEHVPPEAAFNNNKYYYRGQMNKIIELGNKANIDIVTLQDKRYIQKMQGGIGFNSICGKCNNDTGSWYGNDFTNWIYQSMAIILKANKNPTLIYPTYIFPLRIIKQIITMFFTVNNDNFRLNYVDLVKFILNKEERYINPAIKIFCYYNIEGTRRYIGDNILGNFSTNSMTCISEITSPPVGFVMTIDSKPPDKKLTDISHFASYGYNDWIDHFQRFSTLPTHLPFLPGDYRTREEINEKIIQDSTK